MAVGNDILDIGTQKYEQRQQQVSAGSGSMCPSAIQFGEPGAFDVPNVADVSFKYCMNFYSANWCGILRFVIAIFTEPIINFTTSRHSSVW